MKIRIPIHSAFLEDRTKDMIMVALFKMKQVLKQNDYKKLEPIIKKLAQKRMINIQEVMSLTKKSRTTAWRYMQILINCGVVEAAGSTNNIVYKICE